jgi:hypothetical protein
MSYSWFLEKQSIVTLFAMKGEFMTATSCACASDMIEENS